MESFFAKAKVQIWGTSNSWSLAPDTRFPATPTYCVVQLEIKGSKHDGFNLVMSPTGFFTADYWYKTKQEALESAQELFGISLNAWSSKP